MEGDTFEPPSGGRGRGRGRGRGGGGGELLAGIAELDAQIGRAAPSAGPGGRGGGRGDGGGGRGRGRGDGGGGRGRGRGGPVDNTRGPPGLFVKGDWDCPQCGNINWERRTNCNICHADKPSHLGGQLEERTGLGGGFNERQDRASALAVEVDEEGFDDFGRRKDAARRSRREKEAAALARLNASFGLAPTATGLLQPGQADGEASRSASTDRAAAAASSSSRRKKKSRSRSRSRRKDRDRDRDRNRDRRKGSRRSRSRSRSRRRR